MEGRKKKLSRTCIYRITHTLGRADFINWKCRPVLTAHEEDVPLDAGGYIFDLQGYMLSGKLQGSVVELPPCKLQVVRETRKCFCSAYKFPHAPGFAQCKGDRFEQVAPEGLSLEELFK